MEIGNKTGLKLIITVVIVTLAMFVFNTNIVKAVETYDYYNLVDKGPIYDDKNSSISMNDGLSKYSYYVDFDTFSKSDFRVVKVKEYSAVKKSKKFLHFVLDDCTGTDRSAVHQINGEEKLNLIMVSDEIPAGAKLY